MIGVSTPLKLDKIVKEDESPQILLDKIKSAYVLTYIKKKLLETPLSQTGYFFEEIPDAEGGLPTWQVIVTQDEKYFVTHPSKMLGKGAQGEVFLAQNLADRELVAVKVQQNKLMSFQVDLACERANLHHLKRLKGIATVPIKIKGAENAIQAFTFMEYYPGENLLHFLYEFDNNATRENPAYFARKKEHNLLTLAQAALEILKQTLYFNKKKGMAHRDIKTENYVISVINGQVKVTLIDTGVGILFDKILAGEQTQITGTPGYISPERASSNAQRTSYDYRCDLYSTGIVLAELFTEYNYQAEFRKVLRSKTDFKPELTHEDMVGIIKDYLGRHIKTEILIGSYHNIIISIVHLILDLTQKDPSKRPSLEALKERVKAFKKVLAEEKKNIESNSKSMVSIPKKASDPSVSKTKPMLIRRGSELLDKILPNKSSPSSPTGSPKDKASVLSNPSSPHSPSSHSSHSSQGSPHTAQNSPHLQLSPLAFNNVDPIDELAQLVQKLDLSLEKGEYTGNDKGTLLLFNSNIKSVLGLRNNPAELQEGLVKVSTQLNTVSVPSESLIADKLLLLKNATFKCLRPNMS